MGVPEVAGIFPPTLAFVLAYVRACMPPPPPPISIFQLIMKCAIKYNYSSLLASVTQFKFLYAMQRLLSPIILCVLTLVCMVL